MASSLSKLAALVNRVLNRTIGSVTRKIVTSIKRDEPIDLVGAFSDIDNSVGVINSAIISMSDFDNEALDKITKNNVNRFRAYKQMVGQSGTDFSLLSGSNKEIIRRITNVEFDRILLNGGGYNDLVSTIEKKILQRSIDIDKPNIIAEKFYDAVKVFHRDGKKRIMFINKNGKKYSLTPNYYARLMADSVSGESSWTSAISGALRQGTSLVKFNSTGKSKSQYKKEGDHLCSEIDGRIFSVMPNGSVGASGKFYPSIFTVINNNTWMRPHLFCQHKPSPISESAA